MSAPENMDHSCQSSDKIQLAVSSIDKHLKSNKCTLNIILKCLLLSIMASIIVGYFRLYYYYHYSN